MCSPTPCRTCGKTTWTGCGSHIDEVKAMVPAGQWCDGHGETAAADASGGAGRSLLARILGR